jgi:hypothetical protein
MENTIITSEPPATTTKTKKRKMSAVDRKALSEKLKARWAERKSAPQQVAPVIAPPVPPAPLPPSPSVLALQEQVVQRVAQRDEVRQRLTEAHTAYLLAQSKFQAAEAELKGIETEVQYRIGLIAQLENRPAQVNVGYSAPSPILQMPAMPSGGFGGITSEPAQAPQQAQRSKEAFAVASADDLRRDVRGMM